MVNIKTGLCTENFCGLRIDNATGYKSVSNPTGLLIPADVSLVLKDYHMDDVYLFTYLIKNNPNGTFTNLPIPGNIGINALYDSEKSFEQVMIDEEVTQHVQFSEDGYYSVYQLAIPKESISTNVESAAPYTYYVKEVDGSVWMKFNGGEETHVDLYNLLLSCNTDWNNNNIVMLKSNLISKCYLEWCLSAILELFSKYYSDPSCISDSQMLKTTRDKRDLLFAVNNTIQYYVELGQYYQASKLIYDVSFCNVCRDMIVQNPGLNCNCG